LDYAELSIILQTEDKLMVRLFWALASKRTI